MSTEPKTCKDCGSTTHTSRWHDGDVQPRSTRTEAPLKFRKKPVEIEAMQLTKDNCYDAAEWCGSRVHGNFGPDLKPIVPHIIIDTLEGDMRADLGDWIIRGVQGEFYPCKPEIFTQTYEQVSS